VRSTGLKSLPWAAVLGLALAAAPARARAAEPCLWRHPGKPSRLFVDRRVAVMRRYYDAQTRSGRPALPHRAGG
jgi:hypothetical protein